VSDRDQSVLDVIVEQSRRVLETYRVDSGLIEEHANNERRISQGGYGDRQLFELVQNAADEVRDQPGGEIAVVLTQTHLYCANEGSPVTAEGADTILRMSVSRKRGGQIGRFGVGVKSVLAICDTPQFFSRANGVGFGFGFDKEWSAEQIRRIAPNVADTPVLRMAQPLDPDRVRTADPVLDELLKWATTVVRLPLRPASVSRLAIDMKAFPAEFPLFSPHVGTVTLENRAAGLKRQLFQRVAGDRHTIEESLGDEAAISKQWRVFTRLHEPSSRALVAAGELHDRPQVEISWAVPAQKRSRGSFWAYFPTKFETTLRGVLNAPWKTSEDRQAIYDGNAFNNELIEIGATLVVDSLPRLADPKDPGSYIDYLPGRGREAPQFVDERLTEKIWDVAAGKPSLVDQDGSFCVPEGIHLHPEGLREEWLKLWADYSGRPSDWVHHSADRRERRARVALILHRAGRPESSVRQWLEALVADGTAGASATAIRIVAGMVEASHHLAEDATRAHIILTEDGRMVAPVRGAVYRRTTADALADDMAYVDDRVLQEFGIASALDRLGIRDADAGGRFAAVVEQGFLGYTDEQWQAFWKLSRDAGPGLAADLLLAQPLAVQRTMKVMTLNGDLRLAHMCLLPGPVVPADGTRDDGLAVDIGFHGDDMAVLKALGLTDRPSAHTDPQGEPWFDDYREYAWERYLRTLDDKASRPQKATMRITGPNPAGPLRFLRELSPPGRAAYLAVLPSASLVRLWSVQVGRQQDTRKNIRSPIVWMARSVGYVNTSRGLAAVIDCVGPALREHQDLLPVADLSSDVANMLGLPGSVEKIPQRMWDSLIAEAAISEEDGFPGKVYALWSVSGTAWPTDATTRCRIGDEWSSSIEDERIAVTALRDEYDTLIRERIPALLVPTAQDAERLVEAWGLRTPTDVIQKEVRYAAESEPVPLLELFPHLVLAGNSAGKDLAGWSLTRCTAVEEVIRTPNGVRTVDLGQAVVDRTVLVPRHEEDLETLKAVDAALGLRLGTSGCRAILDRRRTQQENARKKAIREAETTDAKLLELVGEDEIRAGLPRGLEEIEQARIGRPVSGERLARLAVNAYGNGVLRQYGEQVAARNGDAPRAFAGNNASRRFVAELRLPESFAGIAAVAPPEMEEVSGPSEYPRLHPYQEQVTERMVDLLCREIPGRGMLRLPTGAGKTRVAVEAVIRVIRAKGGLPGPVLWIAQSEELCEQAVDSWKFVWSKVGPEEKLTVNRFWGGNDAVRVTTNPQLVVATDKQLSIRLDKDEYRWLRNAGVVIVDEAHRAVPKQYTAILESLGLTHRQTERPLVGLTATPFRGNNEAETKRLIARFDGYRLDEGIFPDDKPYAELQRIGVLARVEHRELEGSTLTLSAAEAALVDQSGGFLPRSAEDRLAHDADRNDMLFEEIAKLDPGWPVLVFAASVNHSEVLTAVLNGRGIRSAAISALTPPAERRRTIDDYRKQKIQVITNYGVLAQGFDAPATRAVVIARPTYSPNVYQQMIGRGLRGPKNGGKETCLILDVRDNIENFDRALAFTGFEHLWAAQ